MNANMPTGRGWRRRRRGPCRRPRCRPCRPRRRSRCRRRRRHAVAAPCVKWRRPQRRDARNDVHARHSPSLFMTATSARTPLSSSKPSHRSTPPPRPPPHVGGEKVPVAQVRRHAPARQRWVQHHQLRRLAAPPPRRRRRRLVHKSRFGGVQSSKSRIQTPVPAATSAAPPPSTARRS